MTHLPTKSPRSELLLYQTEDGRTRIQVRLEDETVWLTQADMAQLFQTTPQNITLHLKNIFQEGELDERATCKDFLQVQTEAGRQVQRSRKFYNLDAIISVGYRIKSHVATRFRQWATQRLREYIVKGFTLDDERLKQAGGGNYFDELLIRLMIEKAPLQSKIINRQSEIINIKMSRASPCPVPVWSIRSPGIEAMSI